MVRLAEFQESGGGGLVVGVGGLGLRDGLAEARKYGGEVGLELMPRAPEFLYLR